MGHYGAERQKQVCGCGMLREKPPLRGGANPRKQCLISSRDTACRDVRRRRCVNFGVLVHRLYGWPYSMVKTRREERQSEHYGKAVRRL